MGSDHDVPDGDGAYFDEERAAASSFDATLLEKSLDALPMRAPVVFSRAAMVAEAIRAMQRERRGCVLISEDGTTGTPLIGIFTERDILYRVVEGRRDPDEAPLGEVMTADPETVPREASIAWVLNKMAVGGFRHVPIVDESGCPAFTVSVRDVVHLLVEYFPEAVLNLPPQYASDRAKKREGA